MGAHAAGEEASRIAAERIPPLYEQLVHLTPPEALQRAMRQANAEIFDKGETHPECKGMGTTCTALAVVARGALIGHVGDSRAYRVRGRRVEQLTRDHSLAWECGSPGRDAEGIPKNIITRSIGPHPNVDPDLEGPFPIQNGDVFVLCSDGLSGPAKDAEIGLLASCVPDAERATKSLIGLAIARGAPDNVTVIVSRAGPQEVTKSFAKDEPWPLTDAIPPAPASQAIRWPPLAAAAVCFFLGLVLMGDLVKAASPFVQALAQIGSAAMFLATIICLVYTLVASSAVEKPKPTSAKTALVGRGPYQAADCTPRKPLLEKIGADIARAGDSLEGLDREQIQPLVARIHERVATYAFDDAITDMAEALCIIADTTPRRQPSDTAAGEFPASDRPASAG